MSEQIKRCFHQPEPAPPDIPLPDIPPPGSCAMRLQGLESMPDIQKTRLVDSISTDICAFILCLREHIDAGNIDDQHTRSFDDVVKLIQRTDIAHQRMLMRKVRRLRKERHSVREELRQFHRKAHGLALEQTSQVRILKERVQEVRKQMGVMQWELELLRLNRRWNQGDGDNQNHNQNETEKEPENHPFPEGQQNVGDQELSAHADGQYEVENVKKEGC